LIRSQKHCIAESSVSLWGSNLGCSVHVEHRMGNNSGRLQGTLMPRRGNRISLHMRCKYYSARQLRNLLSYQNFYIVKMPCVHACKHLSVSYFKKNQPLQKCPVGG